MRPPIWSIAIRGGQRHGFAVGPGDQNAVKAARDAPVEKRAETGFVDIFPFVHGGHDRGDNAVKFRSHVISSVHAFDSIIIPENAEDKGI